MVISAELYLLEALFSKASNLKILAITVMKMVFLNLRLYQHSHNEFLLLKDYLLKLCSYNQSLKSER